MRSTINTLTALGLVMSTGLFNHAAQASSTLFKCTTANGAIQYTQRAIAGQKCNLLRVDGTPASAREVQQKLADQRNAARAAAVPSAASQAAARAGDAALAASNAASAAAAQPAKPTPASKEQCEQLAQARATLEQGGRVYEADAKGERSYLTEEQRQARIQEYQNTAKTRCS
jgi:hypothetical protein